MEYLHNGKVHKIKAKKEVIISGGPINSPQILMLSGIGPKGNLKSFDIPVLVDNQAVGSNLHIHILAYLLFKTNDLGKTDLHDIDSWPTFIRSLAQYFLFGTGDKIRYISQVILFILTH